MAHRPSPLLLRFYPFATKRQMDTAKRLSGRVVRAALATGALIKLPCAKCGRKRGVEAHHEDYDKPLVVIWLCRVHHAARHAEIREQNASRVLPVPEKCVIETNPLALLLRRNKVHLLTPGAGRDVVSRATTAVADAMTEERVTPAGLARRLGCSRQTVNNQFAGGVRSLRTLAAIATALGYVVHVSLTKLQSQSEVA